MEVVLNYRNAFAFVKYFSSNYGTTTFGIERMSNPNCYTVSYQDMSAVYNIDDILLSQLVLEQGHSVPVMGKVLLYYLSYSSIANWYDADDIEKRVESGECIQLHEALGYLEDYLQHDRFLDMLPVKVETHDDLAAVAQKDSGSIILRVYKTYINAGVLKRCYDLATTKKVLYQGVQAEAIENIAQGIGE